MRSSRYFQLAFVLFAMLLVSACSGGSGGAQNTATSATIQGVVSFPSQTDQVGRGKLTAASVVDNTMTVEAFTLDGTAVPGSQVHPTYDDAVAVANRIYSYTIPNLKPGVDYVIKAKKGNQVLKKLISKKDAVAGTVQAQTIDAVSTAAVIVASQKLSTNGAGVVLGEPLPSGKTAADLSATIEQNIKPALLEQSIAAAKGNSIANITTADSANYANLYNIVVASVVENLDPAAVCAGNATLTTPVPIFTVSDTGHVTPPSTDATTWHAPAPSTVTTITTATAAGYTAPVENAATYTALAEKFLAAQDIANASLNYEKALSIDPTDKKANFGGAITSGVMLLEDQDVKEIVAKWGVVLPTVNQVVRGSSPVPVSFSNLTSVSVTGNLGLGKAVQKSAVAGSQVQSAMAAFSALQAKLPKQQAGFKPLAKELAVVPATAPSVSEMQSVISNVIIPKVDKILERLAKVEGNGFTFTVTKAMQGNAQYGQDIILSDGEFYTLDAALNVFQTIFEIATAYNFDIPAGYNYNTIQQDPLQIINNQTFFTLKSDGAAKMNKGLSYVKTAVSKATSAFNAVQGRSEGTGAFDLSSWSAADKSDFSKNLGLVSQALNGPTSVTMGDQTVRVDLSKFFTNPVTRANFPTFGYDIPRNADLSATYGKAVAGSRTYTNQVWNGTTYTPVTSTYYIECSLVPTSDIPDYTVNGILPDNSRSNNVVGFNGMIGIADGKLLTGAVGANGYSDRYTTDGTFAYTVVWNATTNGTSFYIRKVDLATGISSQYANLGTNYNYYGSPLVYFNGAFYTTASTYDNSTSAMTTRLRLIYPSGGSNVGEPVLASIKGYGYIGSMTVNGSDLYYIVNSWDFNTRIYRSDFYKLSGLGTTASSPTLLFTKTSESGDYYSIAVSGNTIYTAASGGFGLEKFDMSGQPMGAYEVASMGWRVLVGGSFYGIDNERVLKYAPIPTTPAKLTGLLGKYF